MGISADAFAQEAGPVEESQVTLSADLHRIQASSLHEIVTKAADWKSSSYEKKISTTKHRSGSTKQHGQGTHSSTHLRISSTLPAQKSSSPVNGIVPLLSPPSVDVKANVALDMFLDPNPYNATAIKLPKYELMIWFCAFPWVEPIGYSDSNPSSHRYTLNGTT